MDPDAIRARLKVLEPTLAEVPFVLFHIFERAGQPLHLCLTERLRKSTRKAGVWRAREMVATLKNAAYGFDENKARSAGGRDGIFLLDRTHRPENEMMRKVFDRFLDRDESGAVELADVLGVPLADLLPVRLVSHHLRLLGVLARRDDRDWLVLIDCERDNH